MLVVFDNLIGQLLPGEVLLGPLLIILILGLVQVIPEHSLLLGDKLWGWECDVASGAGKTPR